MDWASVDIAVPAEDRRLPGISMAGFTAHTPMRWDIAVVAHLSVTVLVDLSVGEGVIHAADGRYERGNVAIGLLPGELRTTGHGVGDILQLRLAPAVAAAVLGGPSDLSGTVTALDDLWGRDAGRLEERLRAAGSWPDRFAIASAFLLDRAAERRRPVDPEVAHVWRRTVASGGRARVDGLADEVGWSRTRLWSRFRSQLGVSPKRAARLVRFDHAAHLLAAGHAAAGAAVASGYADQSHLHREAKEFAGLTPSAVAAAPWLAIDDIAWPG